MLLRGRKGAETGTLRRAKRVIRLAAAIQRLGGGVCGWDGVAGWNIWKLVVLSLWSDGERELVLSDCPALRLRRRWRIASPLAAAKTPGCSSHTNGTARCPIAPKELRRSHEVGDDIRLQKLHADLRKKCLFLSALEERDQDRCRPLVAVAICLGESTAACSKNTVQFAS